MTGSRWGTILPSEDAKGLADKLRKSLLSRMTEAGSAEALELLHGIREELDRELAVGKRIPEEIGRLTAEISRLSFADELKPFEERFSLLIAELFNTRSSVSTVCTLARSFHDRLIMAAFDHAMKQLETEGRKDPGTPFAVLVSGELGRKESVLGRRSSFFFIYRDTAAVPADYFDELALRFMAVLLQCFPSLSRNMNRPSVFWYGADSAWSQTAAAALRGEAPGSLGKNNGMTFAGMVETVADMRTVGGDPEFGQAVIDRGRKQLAAAINSEPFWRLAKAVAAMPVALGIFGRIKTVRSGRNRGRFDLKEFALDPLAAAARILALSCGGIETSFTGRMQAILAAGEIGVALADRLLIAYEEFMREMIRLELGGEEETERLFFNPEQLDDESKERFKAGLEDVTTLQRLVHQQLVEVGQG